MTNRRDFDDMEWDEHLCAITEDGPYTGEVVERDPSGSVVAITNYRDGFKAGKEVHYFPDGGLAYEGEWRWGAGGVGVHRAWHLNGQLKELRHYDERGSLARVERWTEDGTEIRRPIGPDQGGTPA